MSAFLELPESFPEAPEPAPQDATTLELRPKDLQPVLQRWRRRKSPKHQRLALALDRVLGGEPYAPEGARDNTLTDLAWDLTWEFPAIAPQAWEGVFAQSVQVMVAEDPDGAPTIETVIDKFRRAQEKIQTNKQKKQTKEQTDLQKRIHDAWQLAGQDRDTPYTPEEIEQYGEQRRWVIQVGATSYYYRVADTYQGPYQTAHLSAAHMCLAPAVAHGGIELTTWTEKGQPRAKTPQELAKEYGQSAKELEFVYDHPGVTTGYIPTSGALRLKCAPLRPIEPRPNPRIAKWLALLAGTAHGQLLQWIAYLTYSDRPCTALYLEGAGGAGKSLLAQGLAQLWADTPVDLGAALSSFNAEVQKTPLLLADEALPTDFRGKSRSADLRSLVQQRSRRVEQKFQPAGQLHGCYRIMLAANGPNLLDSDESLGALDVRAIGERILHIRVSPRATEYLESLPPGETNRWVDGRELAAHALWLREKLPIPSDAPRFLIRPPVTDLHLSMATRSVIGSAVAHWLVSFLFDPQRIRAGRPDGSAYWTQCLDGELCVHPQTLIEHWEQYPTNMETRRANVRSIERALTSLSHEEKKRADGKLLFRVRTDILDSWAHATGMADRGTVRQEIEG